ncbi:hypothetical protein [Streptomyces milbemycinicus]|uniref:hypothetical protein n=1 Tax=Streptomyces milbemycinicus TaxID=476552 RepID=UPI003F4CE727
MLPGQQVAPEQAVLADRSVVDQHLVMALVEVARMDPQAWPDVRDPGSVEEIREAFGRQCWIQFRPHAGAIEVRDIGWAG